MKYLNQILATILGLPFLVFGLNYFLQFMPMPPMAGDAGTFAGLLFTSKYLLIVKIIEITTAVMIIANLKRALALLLLAPVIVNITLFELLLAHQPGIGLLLLILIGVLIFRYREKYLPIIR